MYELENDDEIEIDLRELFLALKKKIVWILIKNLVRMLLPYNFCCRFHIWSSCPEIVTIRSKEMNQSFFHNLLTKRCLRGKVFN